MVGDWLRSGWVNVISHLLLSRAASKARSGGSFVQSGLHNATLKPGSPASFCQRIPVASGQDLSLPGVCDGAGTDLGFLTPAPRGRGGWPPESLGRSIWEEGGLGRPSILTAALFRPRKGLRCHTESEVDCRRHPLCRPA